MKKRTDKSYKNNEVTKKIVVDSQARKVMKHCNTSGVQEVLLVLSIRVVRKKI